MARRLYAFAGEALLCHIPAKHFEYGEELTPQAIAAARSAAKMIAEYASLEFIDAG
jgi:Ni,Fe-hydrogenase maturation factor